MSQRCPQQRGSTLVYCTDAKFILTKDGDELLDGFLLSLLYPPLDLCFSPLEFFTLSVLVLATLLGIEGKEQVASLPPRGGLDLVVAMSALQRERGGEGESMYS